MTRERRITILVLIGTLVVGILIGMLTPGLFHKYRGRMQRGKGGPENTDGGKKEWFAHTINRIVQPDSVQSKKIEPITTWASQQIEAVEVSSNARMSEILDSVKVQLQPILTDEQQQRLSEFRNKAQGKWKGEGDRRH
jgi:hypothetical protein